MWSFRNRNGRDVISQSMIFVIHLNFIECKIKFQIHSPVVPKLGHFEFLEPEDLNNSKFKVKPRPDVTPLSKKNVDPEMNMFTLGLDLTTFGLNLTDSEYSLFEIELTIRKIFPNFGSPYSENPIRKNDPQNINPPQCYLKNPLTLNNKQYFKKFPEETLFYIFYNYPEEIHRFNAVEEL